MFVAAPRRREAGGRWRRLRREPETTMPSTWELKSVPVMVERRPQAARAACRRRARPRGAQRPGARVPPVAGGSSPTPAPPCPSPLTRSWYRVIRRMGRRRTTPSC